MDGSDEWGGGRCGDGALSLLLKSAALEASRFEESSSSLLLLIMTTTGDLLLRVELQFCNGCRREA
eukprot:scaffold29653_cov67-Skeletonema_dohrnii-CCMP3373.AAC.1